MITKTKKQVKKQFRKFLSFIISAVLILSAFIPVTLSPVVSSAASRQISFDSVYEDALSSASSSNQYYFDVPSQGGVTIKFETSDNTKTPSWRARIINASNSTIYMTKDFGSGEVEPSASSRTEYSDKVRLPEGRYYVDISVPEGYAVITNPYKIWVNFASETGGGYAIKPNDTIHNATPMTLNAPMICNISHKTDANWYKITLPYHGSLTLSFSAASSVNTGNWTVLLYDKNEKQLQMKRTGIDGDVKDNIRTNKLDKLRLPPGDYYVKIVPYNESVYSTADYTLTAEYTAERSAKFEKEPNDTAETATNLLVNAPVTGNLSSTDDRDFFKFTIAESEHKEFRIEFSAPASVTQNMWTINLQDDKGGRKEYQAGQNGITMNGIKTFVSETLTLDPGVYYIVIYAYSSYSNSDYTLLVHSDYLPVPVIHDDDYLDYPTEIPLSPYGVNRELDGYIKDADDENIFDFGVNFSGSVSVDFQFSQNITKQSWILNIYDKNDKLYYSGKFGDEGYGTAFASTKTKTSNKIRIPAGSYYIQVLPINSYDYSISPYRLRINYTPEAKEAIFSNIEHFETEPNDTMLTANNLILGSPLTANLSNDTDVDYFKFTLTKNGKAAIAFSTPAAVKHNNWTAELLTGDLTVPAIYTGSFGSDGISESLSDYKTQKSNPVRLPPGTYYIKVSAPNIINYSNEDYQIRVDFTEEISGSGILYETEFNNTPETANALPLNTDMTGNLFNAQDIDYFKITISDPKEVQIKFTVSSKINANLWAIKLYDSGHRELKSYRAGEGGVPDVSPAAPSGESTKHFKTDRIPLIPGTYYIAVIPYSQTEFSNEEYVLKVLDEIGQDIDTYKYQYDKPSDWAEYEVGFAHAYGLVPDDYMQNFTSFITREEFCTLIIKFLEACGKKPVAEILTDLDKTIDYGAFTDTGNINILSANALGIVNGRGGGIFDPIGSITREEAATMLMRLGHLTSISPNIQPLVFNDALKFHDWSADAVTYVSGCIDKRNNRVMNGYPDGEFHPADTYSREQAFMTIFRLYAIKTDV